MPTERLAADLIVANANIRTLDSTGTIAQALAAKGGRIVGVGSNDEIRELADKQTRVIDAGGRTVLPGFIDGHTHFQSAAVQQAILIDYLDLDPKTLAEALEPIRKRAMTLPPGSWIRGDGLMEQYLAERRFPTRYEIDEVAPDNPTVILGVGKHMLAANSLALQLAGITRDTEDPAGGKIDRDEDGEPIGVLRERGKLLLDPNHVDNVLPRYTIEERMDALQAAFKLLHANGVTTIYDMVVDPTEISTYQQLRQRGQLSVRVQLLIRGIETKTPLEHIVALGFRQGLGDEWLGFGGIKMSVDGACVWKNAAVYDCYPGEPDNHGIIRIPQDELDEKVALCNRSGLRVCIHAIGQQGVDMALQALEKALDEQRWPGHRHRIEHAHLPAPDGQLERMARLGIIASMQPSFVWGFGDAWSGIWGRENLRGVMPLRKMHDLGMRVIGNTDFPCVPVSPFLGLRSAVTRLTRDGLPLDPLEAITLDEALRLQTTASAYAGYEEHLKGSLELGKLADLVLISEDPYAVPPEELDRIQVETTIANGEVVFERASAPAAV